MEINSDNHDDALGSFLTINYVKLLTNSNDLCLICMVDEMEDGLVVKPWDRYQMKCQHVFHTRCLRMWCTKKEQLNCSYCGKISRRKINRYCSTCDVYGHGWGDDECQYSPNNRFNELMKLCLRCN